MLREESKAWVNFDASLSVPQSSESNNAQTIGPISINLGIDQW
jgi:hypothetical protein